MKTQIFQPTVNFENLPAFHLPASQPAIRLGCARCRAPEISHDKGNGGGFMQNVVPKTIYPLCHGNSLYPSSLSLLFFIPLARCEGDDSLLRLMFITSHK